MDKLLDNAKNARFIESLGLAESDKKLIFATYKNDKGMKNGISLLLFAVFAAACTYQSVPSEMSGEEARAIMQDVSRRNRTFQPLTERDDTLMQRVLEYYKGHGTSNDLMEVYYLQGSVYRDLHDAPRAMEAFLNGISVADTSNADCRFDILARIYGQRCDILSKQRLYKNATEEEEKVYRYATLADDTILILGSQWGRLGKLYMMCDYQTVADECVKVLEDCKRYGKYRYGASRLCTSVLACLELGRYDDAGRFLEIYEQYSGDVDSVTLESKFPIFYYAKGRLLAAQGNMKLAETFFRRELNATDWNNRQAACRGLRNVFEQTGQLDSAILYARLQCDAVDSAYQEMLSSDLLSLHEMYDYSRAQKESFRKTLQLEEKQRRMQVLWLIMGIATVAVLFVLYLLYSSYERRIATATLKLAKANARLSEQEHAQELLAEQLRHARSDAEKALLAEQVKVAEEETKRQEQEVEEREEELKRLRKWAQHRAKEVRMQYQGSGLFQHLSEKVKDGKVATSADYELVERRLLRDDARLMRRFYKTVPDASDADRMAFLLLRFGMRRTETSSLMAHEQTASAKSCDRMFERTVERPPRSRAEAYNWLLEI